MILSQEILLSIVHDGEWHHQDDFLPLAERVPPEIATRCYLCVSKPTTRARRAREDMFLQVAKGSKDFVYKHLRELIRLGIIKRRQIGRHGRHSVFEYKIARGDNDDIAASGLPGEPPLPIS